MDRDLLRPLSLLFRRTPNLELRCDDFEDRLVLRDFDRGFGDFDFRGDFDVLAGVALFFVCRYGHL